MLVLRSIGVSLLASMVIGAVTGFAAGVMQQPGDLPPSVIAFLSQLYALPVSLLVFPIVFLALAGLLRRRSESVAGKLIAVIGAAVVFCFFAPLLWLGDQSVSEPAAKVRAAVEMAALFVPGWLVYWYGMSRVLRDV